MANSNTIQLRLIVKDDGSVVIDQAAGKIEQFGKKNQQAAQTSASAWSKVKSYWLEIVGAIYAAQKAFDYMDMAAKAEQAEVAFRNITESLRVNADDMVAKMKKASRGTIDESHLMQKALKAMAQDVDPNKIPQLFDAARVGAVKAGEDISGVADQIIDAIANEIPRGLRKFGLITKEQMTIFNKAVASGAENLELLDLVIANTQLQEAKLALETDSSALAIQRFKAQIDELKETLGGWLLTALQKAWGGLQWLAAGASMAAAGFAALAQGVGLALAAINEKLGRTDAAKKFRAEAQEMKVLADAWKGSADELLTKAMGNITGKVEPDDSGKTKTDWAKQQEDAQKRIDELMAKWKALANAEAEEARIKKERDALEQEGRAVFDETRTALEKYQIEIAKLDTLLAKGAIDQDTYSRAVKLTWETYRDSLESVKEATEAIDKQIEALRIEAETYGMTAQQIELYKMKLAGATDEQLKQASAVLNTISAQKALDDFYADIEGTADKTQTIWGGVTDNIAQAFESGFFDMFKNGVGDIEEIWKEFCNTLVESFMRALAQMAINDLLYGTIAGKGEGAATGGLMGWLGNLGKSSGTSGGGFLSSLGGFLGKLWPFDEGGWIPEPVLGRGMNSGRYYSFAENESERVMTQKDISNINRNTRSQSANQRPIKVYFNVTSPDADSFRKSKTQITTDLSRAISLSRRYA